MKRSLLSVTILCAFAAGCVPKGHLLVKEPPPAVDAEDREDLLAYISREDRTLRVYHPEELDDAIEAKRIMLDWEPGGETAVYEGLDGPLNLRVVLAGIGGVVVAPSYGDTRFLDQGRKKLERAESNGACAKGRRTVGARIVTLEGEGDVFAAEVYQPVRRAYLYKTADCREALSQVDTEAAWVLERGPFPNP